MSPKDSKPRPYTTCSAYPHPSPTTVPVPRPRPPPVPIAKSHDETSSALTFARPLSTPPGPAPCRHLVGAPCNKLGESRKRLQKRGYPGCSPFGKATVTDHTGARTGDILYGQAPQRPDNLTTARTFVRPCSCKDCPHDNPRHALQFEPSGVAQAI